MSFSGENLVLIYHMLC